MNKLIVVAVLALIAVSVAMMPLDGKFRGPRPFRFGWRKSRKVAAEDAEEADAEFLGKFLKKVGKVALDAGKMYVGQKYGINLDAEEDEEEADAEFLGKALKKVGKVALGVGKMYLRTQGVPIDAEEEESDAEFLGKALKKVGKVALQVGKAYVGQKYGINLDEEDDEEADSEFLGKVLKKVGKVALNVGKMYARTQGIPIDAEEEEADFINLKKVWGVAKNIGKSYLSSKYGINLDEEEEEEESDSELGALTVAQLQAIMPTLSSSKANEMIGYLNAAMNEFAINTCPRRSAFLAQLAHESGQLRWFEEFASGAAYEGRKDLGNTTPGDGKRYKGRGPIQLTGRANYRSAGQALGLNLEANPTQAATPQVGFRIAGWFWSTRSLNSFADQNTQDSFDKITRRINGGTNGKADRDHFWKAAKKVLGC